MDRRLTDRNFYHVIRKNNKGQISVWAHYLTKKAAQNCCRDWNGIGVVFGKFNTNPNWLKLKEQNKMQTKDSPRFVEIPQLNRAPKKFSSPRILKQRSYETVTTYQMEYLDQEGGAIIAILPCNQDGDIDQREHGQVLSRIENAKIAGVIKHQEIRVQSYRWWNPALVRCQCGSHFYLKYSINQCHKCGDYYSDKGKLIAGYGVYEKKND